jgi:glutaredoxin 3
MSTAVEIYTRPGCGYCSAAKSLLTRKHVEFTEFDAGKNPEFRQEMLARANGGTTFPQIFIDGMHVGGCDELYALERAGKLDELLNGQKEPT